MRSIHRRYLLCLVVAVVAASMALPFAAAADPLAWTRPVPGRVVRPFDPPRSRFGAGHLGADLAADPGTPVRAAGDGRVEFAGVVANTRHVVIRHAGGLRTSYGFLRSIAVRRGQPIREGAVLGTAGGTGENHDGSVLHLGLRVGESYADPMRLFEPADLSQRVRLAPVEPARSGP
jgi:murein DD-endopeptidase MepM/ murein hydrolase activator NlpD